MRLLADEIRCKMTELSSTEKRRLLSTSYEFEVSAPQTVLTAATVANLSPQALLSNPVAEAALTEANGGVPLTEADVAITVEGVNEFNAKDGFFSGASSTAPSWILLPLAPLVLLLKSS